MQHRRLIPSFSSSDDGSNGSDNKSCFDMEDEQEDTNADTELTEVDTNIKGGKYNKEDLPDPEWIVAKDNACLPEYYFN
jgi:hypothetical protein